MIKINFKRIQILDLSIFHKKLINYFSCFKQPLTSPLTLNNLLMYCAIVGTRVNYNAGGMCYDFFSCESKESALKKFHDYHKSFCDGYLTCINCNYYDADIVNDNKPWSPCKIPCDECKIDTTKVNQKCDKCKYCEDCEDCTVYKCDDECEKICYKCDYNGTLMDGEFGDRKCTKNDYYVGKWKCSYAECHGNHDNDGNVKVQIFYLNKEIESWRNCC